MSQKRRCAPQMDGYAVLGAVIGLRCAAPRLTRWPDGPFDLVVLSEIAYYLDADTLAAVVDREFARLPPGATIVAAHWRHRVVDYPMTGDAAHDVITAASKLTRLGGYRDRDVVIEVFETGECPSVAIREGVPGAR
jgi:hypothetical protein